MTLIELINVLQILPSDLQISGLEKPHSYRGDYCQLGLEPTGMRTVAEVLEVLEEALESVYEGYKGGEYKMYPSACVYCAAEGYIGSEITGVILKLGAAFYEFAD